MPDNSLDSMDLTQQHWHDKISHHAQWGGIETAVLDNGPGRGTRIAWVNTGAGLRYKVVLDRAMDIAEAFDQHYSLAWLSHTGVVPPDRFTDQGLGWLRNFGGGLLTTCGLSHVGGPEQDESGARGLHGLISNTPAEIVSVGQPDPWAGQMDMHITGIIKQSTVFGPNLELRRTISSTLGQAVIRIHDEVVNRGNTLAPHMLLYHINFGWPLANEGTYILWQGRWHSPTPDGEQKMFKEGQDFRRCAPPQQAHAGGGEDVAFIDVDADSEGNCRCGLHNISLGLAVGVTFRKAQLPWLTNWQHWALGEYVTGLEPGTHPPIGQARARADRTLIWLAPGARRSYDLTIQVLKNQEIPSFFNHTTS